MYKKAPRSPRHLLPNPLLLIVLLLLGTHICLAQIADDKNVPFAMVTVQLPGGQKLLVGNTEITNNAFSAFVVATGYITDAEKPDVNGHRSGGLLFAPTAGPVNLEDFTAWWRLDTTADWQHPQGAGSNIVNKGNYPVVQVSFNDAKAYCKWAGCRLPSAKEWETIALLNANDLANANTWQGNFPYLNTRQDGWQGLSPAGFYRPGKLNLYDMAGNVWEWCSTTAANGNMVLKGGSFLCSSSYCSGYLPQNQSTASNSYTAEHIGFRCVKDAK